MSATVAKRATVRATMEFIRADHSEDVLSSILQRLPEDLRTRLTSHVVSTEIPYVDLLALWRAADDVLASRDSRWMERAGAYSIESSGVQLYSGILRKRSPTEFLTQSVSLFQLYYAPGDMEVVEEEGERAVLRLSGFESLDRLFCRRQTGGLQCALRLAGGEKPQVKHVRCAHEDDAFCEWELSWGVDSEPVAVRRDAGEAGL